MNQLNEMSRRVEIKKHAKLYARPELTRFGLLEELTQTLALQQVNDGGGQSGTGQYNKSRA